MRRTIYRGTRYYLQYSPIWSELSIQNYKQSFLKSSSNQINKALNQTNNINNQSKKNQTYKKINLNQISFKIFNFRLQTAHIVLFQDKSLEKGSNNNKFIVVKDNQKKMNQIKYFLQFKQQCTKKYQQMLQQLQSIVFNQRSKNSSKDFVQKYVRESLALLSQQKQQYTGQKFYTQNGIQIQSFPIQQLKKRIYVFSTLNFLNSCYQLKQRPYQQQIFIRTIFLQIFIKTINQKLSQLLATYSKENQEEITDWISILIDQSNLNDYLSLKNDPSLFSTVDQVEKNTIFTVRNKKISFSFLRHFQQFIQIKCTLIKYLKDSYNIIKKDVPLLFLDKLQPIQSITKIQKEFDRLKEIKQEIYKFQKLSGEKQKISNDQQRDKNQIIKRFSNLKKKIETTDFQNQIIANLPLFFQLYKINIYKDCIIQIKRHKHAKDQKDSLGQEIIKEIVLVQIKETIQEIYKQFIKPNLQKNKIIINKKFFKNQKIKKIGADPSLQKDKSVESIEQIICLAELCQIVQTLTETEKIQNALALNLMKIIQYANKIVLKFSTQNLKQVYNQMNDIQFANKLINIIRNILFDYDLSYVQLFKVKNQVQNQSNIFYDTNLQILFLKVFKQLHKILITQKKHILLSKIQKQILKNCINYIFKKQKQVGVRIVSKQEAILVKILDKVQ